MLLTSHKNHISKQLDFFIGKLAILTQDQHILLTCVVSLIDNTIYQIISSNTNKYTPLLPMVHAYKQYLTPSYAFLETLRQIEPITIDDSTYLNEVNHFLNFYVSEIVKQLLPKINMETPYQHNVFNILADQLIQIQSELSRTQAALMQTKFELKSANDQLNLALLEITQLKAEQNYMNQQVIRKNITDVSSFNDDETIIVSTNENLLVSSIDNLSSNITEDSLLLSNLRNSTNEDNNNNYNIKNNLDGRTIFQKNSQKGITFFENAVQSTEEVVSFNQYADIKIRELVSKLEELYFKLKVYYREQTIFLKNKCTHRKILSVCYLEQIDQLLVTMGDNIKDISSFSKASNLLSITNKLYDNYIAMSNNRNLKKDHFLLLNDYCIKISKTILEIINYYQQKEVAFVAMVKNNHIN